MKKCDFNPLTFALLLLTTTVLSSNAWAQKIKVKKVKGNAAIIETSVPLQEGQSYDLQTSPISADVNYSGVGFKSRQNSLTLGLNFSMLQGSSVQENYLAAQGRYGWNYSFLEFGIAGDIAYSDIGTGATTDFSLGGYFDYNLITNRDLRTLIYGPFALITIGSRQLAAGGSTGLMNVNAGGFVSFFMAQSSTALRLEGFLEHRQINASVGQSSLTGFGARGLIVFYF